jgi:hypothetical protein
MLHVLARCIFGTDLYLPLKPKKLGGLEQRVATLGRARYIRRAWQGVLGLPVAAPAAQGVLCSPAASHTLTLLS